MQNATLREESFYGTPSGRVCVSLLGERLRWFWPELANQSVLGLGSGGAMPYLHTLGDSTTLRIGACLGSGRVDMALQHGQTCVVDPAGLPFEEQKFDRIVLVHALHGRENPLTLLRSAARVLKDDGRLLMVVPVGWGGGHGCGAHPLRGMRRLRAPSCGRCWPGPCCGPSNGMRPCFCQPVRRAARSGGAGGWILRARCFVRAGESYSG